MQGPTALKHEQQNDKMTVEKVKKINIVKTVSSIFGNSVYNLC